MTGDEVIAHVPHCSYTLYLSTAASLIRPSMHAETQTFLFKRHLKFMLSLYASSDMADTRSISTSPDHLLLRLQSLLE
jgi:hypothetical protein